MEFVPVYHTYDLFQAQKVQRRGVPSIFIGIRCGKILDRELKNRSASHPTYQLSGVNGTCRHNGSSIVDLDRDREIKTEKIRENGG